MGVPTGELGTNALAGGKFRDYISMVESIHKKEQFAVSPSQVSYITNLITVGHP